MTALFSTPKANTTQQKEAPTTDEARQRVEESRNRRGSSGHSSNIRVQSPTVATAISQLLGN